MFNHNFLKPGVYIKHDNCYMSLSDVFDNKVCHGLSHSKLITKIYFILNNLYFVFSSQESFIFLRLTSNKEILLMTEGFVERRSKLSNIPTKEYCKARLKYASHIPTPIFCLDENSNIIREKRVKGRGLQNLQSSLIQDVFWKFARLYEEYSKYPIKSNAVDSIIMTKISVFITHYSKFDYTSLAWVYSHGDLSPKNIFILKNEDISVIDIEPKHMIKRPYWYDPVYFIFSSSMDPSIRNGLLRDYMKMTFRVVNLTVECLRELILCFSYLKIFLTFDSIALAKYQESEVIEVVQQEQRILEKCFGIV